jgi:exopolysaccharide production protein ExoZ
MPETKYIYGLDLVRFSAALSVAVFHLSWQLKATYSLIPAGWVGVEIFFVISGLVIANSASQSSPWSFVRNRFLRLYPAAWGCVLLSSAAIFLGENSQRTINSAVELNPTQFVHSLTLLMPPFVSSAYWTLPIEIAFYAVVLVLVSMKAFDRFEWLAVALTIWSAPYLTALWMVTNHWIDIPGLDLGYGLLNATLLRHGPYFALGILIWLVAKRRITRLGVICLAAIPLLAGMEIESRASEVANRFPAPMSTLWLSYISFSAFLAIATAILLMTLFPQFYPKNSHIRLLTRQLGLWTYPFYLLHEAVGGNVMGVLVKHAIPMPLALASALIVTAGASFIVVRFWESPLKGSLRRLLSVRSSAPVSL